MSDGKFHFGHIGAIRISWRSQFGNHIQLKTYFFCKKIICYRKSRLYLSGAAYYIYTKIVGITDWIRLSIALIKVDSEAHGLAHWMRQNPLKVDLEDKKIFEKLSRKPESNIFKLCQQKLTTLLGKINTSADRNISCNVSKIPTNNQVAFCNFL